MAIRLHQITNHISNKINEKTGLLENPEYNISEKEQEKLKHEIEVLKELHDEIIFSLDYNTDNVVFDILKNNYGKYDTLIKFFNKKELLVSKNTVSILKGEWIFNGGSEEEFEAGKQDGTVYREGYNMNDVCEVRTIKPGEENEE